MPHTSHKKKTIQNKRRQVVDDNGWTRVITSSGLGPSRLAAIDDLATGNQELKFKWAIEAKSVDVNCYLPGPQKPLPGISLEQMTVRYQKLEAKWLESNSYQGLRNALSEDRIFNGRGNISTCVLLGSGSVSAPPQGRDYVAYYQIAAFKSAVDTIQQLQGHRPIAYAQEPFYNELDVTFLRTLDISVVDHPKGFEILDDATFVYSPFAEQRVELQIMYHRPRLWLHRDLGDPWPLNADGRPSTVRSLRFMLQGRVSDPQNPDWASLYGAECSDEYGERHLEEEYMINHQLHQTFKETHNSLALPDLNASNYPFQDCFIHWLSEADDESQPAPAPAELQSNGSPH